jgi:hypothetical protein
MSKFTTFAGGSEVCRDAREVALVDDVISTFQGCRTELALIALSVARDEDAVEVAFLRSQKPLAVAVREVSWEDEDPKPQRNLTAEWMKVHYTEVFQQLVQHLSSKMTRSRELGVVEDHVQKLIVRLIQKDQLAPHLVKGGEPKMSVLRMWAYQSAVTELRRWGVDACLRATRNAKTSREVKQGSSWRVVQSAYTMRESNKSDEGPMSETPTPDMFDPNEVSPEDLLDRSSRVAKVRQTLIRMGHGNLVPVVNGLLEGRSLTELRETYGVSTDHITTVLESLRD